MLNNRDYKNLHNLINIAYVAAFILIIYLVLRYALGIFAPFIVALFIALLTDPLVQFMVRKFHFSRGIAGAISIVVLVVLILFLCGFLSTKLWGEAKSFFSELPHYFEALYARFQSIMDERPGILGMFPKAFMENAKEYVINYDYSSLLTGSVGSKIFGYAGNMVMHIPSGIVFLAVTVVSCVFMIGALPSVKRFILYQFNEKNRALIIAVKKEFFSTIRKYICSYFLLIALTFTELLIFFLIFDFRPAFSLALLISFVDILPVLGIGTVLLPWALICLLIGAPWRALILLCIYVVVTIVRQILEPKMIGDYVGVAPIVTILSMWIGLKLFGFLGIFILPISIVVLKNLHESGKIQIWKTPP